MKTTRFVRRTTRASLLGTILMLGAALTPAWGQYGGLFVSATPQSPIQPGQALDIAVVVHNTSD